MQREKTVFDKNLDKIFVVSQTTNKVRTYDILCIRYHHARFVRIVSPAEFEPYISWGVRMVMARTLSPVTYPRPIILYYYRGDVSVG